MKSLTLFKALADESRLGIFRLLLERESHGEVISERLKLAPSTVSFHLKKLLDAGLISFRKDQYYTIYFAAPGLSKMTVQDLVFDVPFAVKEQDQSEEKYKDKVLKSFFKYGRLVKIPSQKMKREWVVQKIAENFHENKSYNLRDVLEVLGEIYDEPNLLLKEMQAFGVLEVKGSKVQRLMQRQNS